jgi:hypothetical protein
MRSIIAFCFALFVLIAVENLTLHDRAVGVEQIASVLSHFTPP